MNLTTKEKQVIEYMKQGFDSDGCFDGDWYFTEDMKVEGLSQKSLGGVLSSLEQKGIVVCQVWDNVDHMAILKELLPEDHYLRKDI